jgi:CheY-like chemotaxis protein
LDINMPGRTGWEVLQQLKDQDETFRYPVIVCSIEDDKPRGYQLGATEYLIKPFLEEELVAAFRRVELERDLPRVLIIGDQPESLRSIREALTVQEDILRLLEATSSDQGLAMIGSHRPALVILD